MQKKSETYAPSEDTFLLASVLEKERGQSSLEIGTGSGYLAEILQKNFPFVVATDIDFEALRDVGVQNKICCDAAGPLAQKFDLVVCNLPYLPSDGVVDRTVDGGAKGLEVPLKILNSAIDCVNAGGMLLFLTSSLAEYEKLLDLVTSRGFSASIVAKKKLFFEELIVVRAELFS